MTVSAFWHGIHPGYYLSFLTIPPNLIAEELMAAAFRSKQTEEVGDKSSKFKLNAAVFDWICWFFKMRSFDYMCMSFLLLGLYETVRYWYSIYFIVHVYIAVFIIVGLVNRPRKIKTEIDTALKSQ
jgi:lysophospholipid acyltransferase 7